MGVSIGGRGPDGRDLWRWLLLAFVVGLPVCAGCVGFAKWLAQALAS